MRESIIRKKNNYVNNVKICRNLISKFEFRSQIISNFYQQLKFLTKNLSFSGIFENVNENLPKFKWCQMLKTKKKSDESLNLKK